MKRYKWVHYMWGVLLVNMVAISMIGCSKEGRHITVEEQLGNNLQSDVNSHPSYLEDTTPITLDWYVNFSWFNKKWGGDYTSEYITKKTGVSVNFIVPEGNEAEKINSMIQSDTLPDLITLGWWESPVNALIDGDLVYALDTLADKYDPYFYQVADPERLSWYTLADGHIYGYPNASYAPKDYIANKLPSNQTFMVRKDIYEAIGSPDMRTPEGFLTGLKAAQKLFPAVDGQPLIPIGFQQFGDAGCVSLEDYLQNFLAIPREDEAGNLYDRSTDPEYIKWLKVFRQANEEGLISMDVFIDGRPQMEEKIEKGRYFALLFQRSDMVTQNSTRYQKDADSVYIAVDGPANERLQPPVLPGDGINGWTITLISKSCENPERAIRFMSYLMSEEGQLDTYMGPEGQSFEYVNGKPKLLPEVKVLLDQDKATFDNTYGAYNNYWMLMDNAMTKKWEEAPTEPYAQPYLWTLGKVQDVSAYSNLNLDPNSELFAEHSKIQEKWGKVLPQLIQAESEEAFDLLFKDYLDYREAHRFREIKFYQQKKFELNKARLGIK